MTFTTKNFIKFILCCIALSICFAYLFGKKYFIGIPLGLFLSLCICYDPKRYEASKKKYEEKLNAKMVNND